MVGSMKTKVLYVLVSGPGDLYLGQAFVSMYSVKRHTPGAHIVLLTDHVSDRTFAGPRAELLRYVDEKVVIDLPEDLTAQERSRLLKTGMGLYVGGDFLYVDCDTVIVRPLDSIDGIPFRLAAVRDAHCAFRDSPYREANLHAGARLGWPVEGEDRYFNGGVMLVREDAQTRAFFQGWQDNLRACWKVGLWMDQPALAKTDFEQGHPLQELPDGWNCQLKHGIKYLKEAFVVHYLTTNPSEKLFLLNDPSVLEAVQGGELSEAILRTVEDPFEGIASCTHTLCGEELYLLRTRRYRCLRKHFRRGRFSLAEWLLKVYDHLFKS